MFFIFDEGKVVVLFNGFQKKNIMSTSENMIQDYDAVLDARYGKKGSTERIKFEEDAYAYYTGIILRNARKEAKISQEELAKRTQTTKSYISRIENGVIIPSVAVFYRMINALGMSVKIINPNISSYDISARQTRYLSDSKQGTYNKKGIG